MKTKISLKSTLFGLVLMALPMLMMAQPGQGPQRRNLDDAPGEGRKQMMERIPDLTDAQRESIESIHLQTQKDVLPLRNQVNEMEARLLTLQTAGNADMKAINAQIDEIALLRAKMDKRRAQSHQDVRKLLTEEQRTALDMHFVNKGDKRGGRKGGPGGPR